MTELEQVQGVLALARLEGRTIAKGVWAPAEEYAAVVVPGWTTYPMVWRWAFLRKVWACVKTR